MLQVSFHNTSDMMALFIKKQSCKLLMAMEKQLPTPQKKLVILCYFVKMREQIMLTGT